MLSMLYNLLEISVAIFFNIFNIVLKGNLPPFGTVCVLVEQDGQYLVVEQKDGSVVLPGGFMRWKERSEQTAQREGKEETGLDLRIGDIVACYTTPSIGFTSMSTVTIVHRAEVGDGELRSSIEGRPCWVDEEALRNRSEERYITILNDYQDRDKQQNVTSTN